MSKITIGIIVNDSKGKLDSTIKNLRSQRELIDKVILIDNSQNHKVSRGIEKVTENQNEVEIEVYESEKACEKVVCERKARKMFDETPMIFMEPGDKLYVDMMFTGYIVERYGFAHFYTMMWFYNEDGEIKFEQKTKFW